jgi:cell fate regulator YaaT (PSP1 superfamily)
VNIADNTIKSQTAGQCGIKCCLNYELDTYMDALKGFPDFETKLVTEKGDAICQNKIF